MNPGLLNLSIRSGDTYTQLLTVCNPGSSANTPGTPVDLTGCVAELQIVSTYSVAPVYALSSVTPTTHGGTITLGGTAGTITISIPPADTLQLANGQYDLKIKFSDNSIQTLITGSVFVEQEVTAWT